MRIRQRPPDKSWYPGRDAFSTQQATAADRADKDHAACRELLENDQGPLVTTAMVIAEAAYLIDRQLGAKAEASLYASIIEGQMEVADLDIDDRQRIQDLVSSLSWARLVRPAGLLDQGDGVAEVVRERVFCR